ITKVIKKTRSASAKSSRDASSLLSAIIAVDSGSTGGGLGSEQNRGQGQRRPGSKMGPLYPARRPLKRCAGSSRPALQPTQSRRLFVLIGRHALEDHVERLDGFQKKGSFVEHHALGPRRH